jgi:hypothetical protein
MRSITFVPRFALLLLIAVGAARIQAESGTLAGNKQLPAKSIEALLPKAEWEYLSAKKISRLVGFRAAIRSDTSVRLGRIFRAVPDASWNEPAKGFAEKVRLNFSNSSSGLGPRADIYVVFFEPATSGDRLVLVYGEESGSGGQPSESPNPSTARTAAGSQYLQTFAVEPAK